MLRRSRIWVGAAFLALAGGTLDGAAAGGMCRAAIRGKWEALPLAVTAYGIDRLKAEMDASPTLNGFSTKVGEPFVFPPFGMPGSRFNGLPPATLPYHRSPLGYCGPLGPFGPLGPNGPLGILNADKRPQGPKSVVATIRKASVTFGAWFDDLWRVPGFDPDDTKVEGGPLGPNGPLGAKGPLGPSGALGKTYCRLGDGQLSLLSANLTKHMQAGGVWAALGPVGPLGPLGPLGALGPLGPTHLIHDDQAQGPGRVPGVLYSWKDGKRETVRDLVAGPDWTRRYEWVEFFPGSTARDPSVPKDSSFLADGELPSIGQEDRYQFTSDVAQYVTVAVIPGNPADAYHLAATLAIPGAAAPTAPLASTNGRSRYVNHIHVRVPAGTRFDVRVKRAETGSEDMPACPWDYLKPLIPELNIGPDQFVGQYRLVVVGSTAAVDGTDIRGVHQATYR